MAKSCEDVSARMMELLYGEVSEGERASLEGHIAGCARCGAEREGFETTRAMARGALDEAVPARAHAAILRAAAEHLAANPSRELAASRVAEARPRMSFWEWFRTRWTLPTLATVGAVAVVLIGGKVFLDPKRTYERGQEALGPARTAAPAPATAPEPGAPPMFEPSAAAPKPKREIGDSPLDGLEGVSGRESSEKAGKRSKGIHYAKGARGAASPAADNKKIADSPLDGLLGATRRDRAKDEDGSLGGIGRLSSGGAASGAGSAATAERRQFAPPPPPREAAKPAAKMKAPAKETSDVFAQPPPARPGKREIADDMQLDGDLRGVGGKSSSSGSVSERKADKAQEPLAKSAPAPRGEPPATAAAPAAPPPSPTPRPTSAPVATVAPSADAEASRSSSKKSRAPAQTRAPAEAESSAAPTDALAQRADRLFADGRWTEAAAAYRELLRLDPRNAAAARWRTRLSNAQGQAEIASRRPAPAAKASKAEMTDKPAGKASLDSAPPAANSK